METNYVERIHYLNDNLDSDYKICIDSNRNGERLFSPEIGYTYHIFKRSTNNKRVFKRIKYINKKLSYSKVCETAIKVLDKIIQDEN